MNQTTGRCTVQRERGVRLPDPDHDDPEEATVRYRERGDGWYVKTPEDDDFWLFARPEARERDVRVLIFKKWCHNWNPDPDPLDDRS